MRWFVGIAVVAFLTVGTALARADQKTARASFQQSHPQVAFYQEENRITRVYGLAFSFGATPEESAAAFVQNDAAMLGVDAADLIPGNHFNDVLTQPVMYEPDLGDYKFILAYYAQYKDGVPVYRAGLRLLVRNEEGYPLVLAASSLHNLGDFTVPPGAATRDPGDLGHAAASALVPDLRNFTPSSYVVWAGVDEPARPALAVQFIADNGLQGTSRYAKRLFLADATTAEILHWENLILNTDVTGSVHGLATTIPKADNCNPEVDTVLPYAKVSIDTTVAYADADGNFIIPNDGTSPVTVKSYIAGKYFVVQNQGGSNTILSMTVTPPGPADFMHNADNNQEFNRAEVNGYVQGNVVRDFALAQNPSYPVVHSQLSFPVKVNINDSCNAYYDYSSINMFRAGGGCANTAYSAVIHHEYGHHLVATGGSGQGAYGEGMGDCMSALIADDPILAYGFFSGQCNSGIRNADNGMQYPCSGEIHECGQLLSGCVWSTRTQLLNTNPTTYREIIANLTVNSILLHNGDSIGPSITIDFLTLDDDNGNVNDGTPHWFEICAAFGAHNMDCPTLTLLAFDFPDGRPEMLDPNGSTTIRVVVSGVGAQPEPGTGMLYYRIGDSDWASASMLQVSPDVYDAVIPPAACGSGIAYYFSAQTTSGQTAYGPPGAPAVVYAASSGYGWLDFWSDDFETNQGWTVTTGATTGNWEWAVPQQTTYNGQVIQPGSDHTPDGTLCYVTGAAAGDGPGDNDVDGGPTHLISPVIDLTGTDAMVSYWCWYYITPIWRDKLEVSISNDNGASWVTAATVSEPQEWTFARWRVSQFVAPTAQVRVRFTAADYPNDSLIEALIDDFKVETVDCTPPPLKGDLNCDGVVNAFDIDPFVLALTDPAGYQAQYPNCDILLADCNNDGVVNPFDIDPFVALLTGK